ncbi:type VI secretion system Vgr family protein [Xanthomonas oryzae pv. oryzicola]|uniref:type VI secretion system Vgr family protein n=1 Tax=Xanthomonas oryzae TaxID=347 RepID=UPI000B413DA2|nr:type VI secretion system Vgr family protein [Xanthomonas oryzae]OWB28829.1 type IV secretion protein Rhs [Xanthomonas oryzae pv. oryzicola]
MADLEEFVTLFSGNRLHRLNGSGPLAALQVARWAGWEALSRNYHWDIYALATEPDLDLDAMLGQRVELQTEQQDGSLVTRSGLVDEAECIGYDGGLASYHLRLVPWLQALVHGRNQRTFVGQTLPDILSAVFAEYAEIASWRFTDDAEVLIRTLGPYDYRVQYRTQDNFDFVAHLLAEVGLGFCFVEDSQSPSGHTLLIFDDSYHLPEDATSARLGGIPQRQTGGPAEASDVILDLGQSLALAPDRITVISTDYRTRQAVTASTPVGNVDGSREWYDDVGPEAFDTAERAQQLVKRQADAVVSQAQTWVGRSTVRGARTGNGWKLRKATWMPGNDGATPPDAFVLTEVAHVGVNNLPQTVMAKLRRHDDSGAIAQMEPRLLAQAQASGYVNRFRAVPRTQLWRPTLADGTGQRLNPAPTALGAQSARVAGAQGEVSGSSSPILTDAQGRVRLRYHWSEGAAETFPTRAVQRLASEGHGLQQTLRIGQEALVQFDHGLIHRPVVLGGLYNGVGEGGQSPTPGGAQGTPMDLSVYAKAADQRASAQGNLTGGNSPAWHGAGPGADRHGHAAALSGFKSQGFDEQGFNHLLTDDSDGQGRVALGTTHETSQLNLGHLRHQADNYLGSFRGTGYELRTDAYGAVRGTRGVLISSYGVGAEQPAGDVSGLLSQLGQQRSLAKTLDKAAEQHLTLPLAAERGVQQPGQSRLDGTAAPLQAIEQSFATTVSGESVERGLADAPSRSKDNAIPHTADAMLGIGSQDSLGMIAGQDLHWSAGETLTVGSGQDLSLAIAKQVRLHSQQGISWLAGASKADALGLGVIAGKDNLDMQAQHDAMAFRARDALTVGAVHANVDVTAAKSIHLSVSGGASITIDGGQIVWECPGNLTVYAQKLQFLGPAQMHPKFPQPGDPKVGDYAKDFSV